MDRANGSKRLRQAVLSAAVVTAMSGAAHGATVTWNNIAGGSWGTASNWTGGTGTGANLGLPSTTDDARLDLNAASYIVNYDADLYSGVTPNHRMNSVTVTNTGAGRTTALNISATNFKTAGNLTIQVGGTMNVVSGGSVISASNVMTQSGGLITLAAGGSISMTATTTANVLVGNDSNGTFTMTGGTLSSAGLESAPSPRGIMIGSSNQGNANGTMTVSGGSVTNAGLLNIGKYSGTSNNTRNTSSSLTLSGASAWSNAGNIVLGQNLNTTTNGAASVVTGSLTVQGGTFTPGATSVAFVGAAKGVGNLNVSGGSFGTAANPLTDIRLATRYTTDPTSIAKGKGTLNLSGGAIFTKQFSTDDPANSFINFTGGTLNTGGTTVNNGSAFVVGNGSNAAALNLIAGGTGSHTFANGLQISNNATLSGVGTIIGDTTLGNGSSLLLKVGDTLAITGNLILDGSDTVKFTGTADGTSNYVVATYSGALLGAGTLVLDSSLPAGYSFNTATPGQLMLVVPEPGVATLTAASFGLLALRRRRI